MQHDGLFPGAACCHSFWPYGAMERITRGGTNERQSGSPPGGGQTQISFTYQSFEDEDEDEDDASE